ncbi:MAG: hypothetical protein Q9227_008933 [Pyrenula ochraceoflavens]
MSDTQTALNNNFPVYIGVWTNWSLGGRATGSVITLTHRNGAFLTAFLAVFVTFAGSRLWRILCFVLHQFLLSKSAQDGLYHQRQAILRNAMDEKSGFFSLGRVLWAWHVTAHRPYYRMIPIISFALLASIVFALGGLFSSRISSSMGNEVLLASPNCGTDFGNSSYYPQTAEQNAQILQPWLAERLDYFSNYAQRCYSDSAQADGCTPYVQRRISSTVDRNATCPFEQSMCRHPDKNIRLDTGLINSQTDIGLNTPSDLQFNVRFVTHCGPLRSEGYSETVHYSPDKPYKRYSYGQQLGSSDSAAAAVLSNYTYEVPELSAEELRWRKHTSPFGEYTVLSLEYALDDPSYSNLLPIEKLKAEDGDTALVFLSANGVFYMSPVDDDWYAAHQAMNYSVADPSMSSAPVYLADEPASVLGCKIQYQTCNSSTPSEESCSKLSGSNSIAFTTEEPTTKRDQALYWGLYVQDINNVVQMLQSSALMSRFGLSIGEQGPLPANQWQIEVENWFNVVLAAIQGHAVDSAVGPGSSDMLKYFWTKPNNDVEKQLCKNQKIISASYTNFSLIWLVIVLAIGTFIMLLEYFLESIVLLLEKHKIVKTSCQEWFSNDLLQLQRMAHEELGLGNWKGCTGPRSIPVTNKGQSLGMIDAEDPEHPRLKAPSEKLGTPVSTTTSESFTRHEKISEVRQEVLSAASGLVESGNGDRKDGIVERGDMRNIGRHQACINSRAKEKTPESKHKYPLQSLPHNPAEDQPASDVELLKQSSPDSRTESLDS